MRLPRRAVAVQQMSRRSSPSRYSRRLSKSRPRPRCCARRSCRSIWRLRARKICCSSPVAQRRVDAHRLGERRPGPALGQAQQRAIAHVEPARLPVAALLGLDAIAQPSRHARKCRQPVRRRFGRPALAADRPPAGTRESSGRGSRWSARSRSRCRAPARWTRSGWQSALPARAGATRRAAQPAAPAPSQASMA